MKSRRLLTFPLLLIVVATLACARSAGGGDTPAVVPQPSDTPKPSGPCYNILFPFVPGYQWVYEVKTADTAEDPSQLGLTVQKVEENIATIESLDLATGIMTETQALCDNGTILNYPALTQKMLLGSAYASDFTLEYVSGVFAPPEAAFTSGDWSYQWEAEYIANGAISVQDEGEALDILLQDSPVHLTWQTAGAGDAAFEVVTVPAGTFDRALKTQRVVTMEVALSADGLLISGTLTLNTTQWYEPFVGLLKSQIDTAEITYMGISFPLEVNGTVELVEFRP